MKVALVTDVWEPQVNGLVHTWQHMQRELAALGHELVVLHPARFPTRPLPRYPDYRLVLRPFKAVRTWLAEQSPDAIHIATEGMLGIAARAWCLRNAQPFTTSYHARLTAVLPHYTRVPRPLIAAYVRWFHAPATVTLAPSASVRDELESIGIHRTELWRHGVDIRRFQPGAGNIIHHLPRPIFLYVGRVAREKQLDHFLRLDLPGSKVVVGDGPALPTLRQRYPDAHWQGSRTGDELVRHYNDADVLVFPSQTDTFGMVLLEANACGVPVAAYPVPGPIDVLSPHVSGVMHHDLRRACLEARHLDPEACRQHAQQFNWARAARALLRHITPLAHSHGLAVQAEP